MGCDEKSSYFIVMMQTDSKTVTGPPTQLKFIKYEMTSSCYAISWREDGNILCCTYKDGIEVRSATDPDTEMRLIKRINITGDVYTAYSVGDKLITKVSNDDTVSTYIGSESTPQQTLLHQYVGDNYSQLSVSDSIIADIDSANKQLMIYTITGDHQYDIDISEMSTPTGVHILSDGDGVLVSDSKSIGEVRKYKLRAGQHHQPVWRCTGLTVPLGITSDQSGLIYVTSAAERKIYLISPLG